MSLQGKASIRTAMQKKVTRPAITAALMLSLSACSHPPPPALNVLDVTRLDFAVEPVSPHIPAGLLRAGHTFGQTFVANHDGLTKIEVLVATYRATLPSGDLVLHLRAYPDQQNEIASAVIPAPTIKDNGYVALGFPPIDNSAGKSYYFYLEPRDIPPNYPLTVWRSTTEVYPNGHFYIDRQPQRQDVY